MEPPALEKKKFPKLTTVIIVVSLLVAGFLRIQQSVALKTVNWADVTMRGQTFKVEVADNDAKQELGLGDRDSLSADHGMYFPFATAKYWVFWMKGMRFPIDIIWIQEGKVVDVSPDAPVEPGLPVKTYSPIEPADAVLEVNAGTASRIGLQKGDEVSIGQPGSTPPSPALPETATAPAPVTTATATPIVLPLETMPGVDKLAR
jgi:uncharacterized membrane protein (UPF0127 family)